MKRGKTKKTRKTKKDIYGKKMIISILVMIAMVVGKRCTGLKDLKIRKRHDPIITKKIGSNVLAAKEFENRKIENKSDSTGAAIEPRGPLNGISLRRPNIFHACCFNIT